MQSRVTRILLDEEPRRSMKAEWSPIKFCQNIEDHPEPHGLWKNRAAVFGTACYSHAPLWEGPAVFRPSAAIGQLNHVESMIMIFFANSNCSFIYAFRSRSWVWSKEPESGRDWPKKYQVPDHGRLSLAIGRCLPNTPGCTQILDAWRQPWSR